MEFRQTRIFALIDSFLFRLKAIDQNKFYIFMATFSPLQEDVIRFLIRRFVPPQSSSTKIDDGSLVRNVGKMSSVICRWI